MLFGSNVDTTIIFYEPYRLVLAFPVLCGLYMLSIFLNMIYYEITLYNGAGEDYLKYGKEIMERNYWYRLILNIPMEIEVRPCCLTKYWFKV